MLLGLLLSDFHVVQSSTYLIHGTDIENVRFP